MAGCGLSEDTFFSSFFYNYGSSWETPSNQVRGGSGPGGVAPHAPRCALTWHSAGRQRLGRGWGGWGAKWVALSGSVPTGERRCPSSPSTSSPVSRVCRVPPVPNLPPTPTPPPPPSPAGTQERSWSRHVTPNNSGQNQGTRAQPSPSRRGRRAPVRPAPARPPVAPRGCGAASPPRCALPPPLPPGPEPPLSLKWLQSQVEASPDPADGGGQSGCSGAHNPAPPPARTNTPKPHTLNFDDCAMQSGCIVPSTLPAAGL